MILVCTMDNHHMHKRTLLFKGLFLLFILTASITSNPAPTHTVALQTHKLHNACEDSENPVSLIDNVCSGKDHHTIKYLIGLVPFTRLCSSYSSGRYQNMHPLTPTPIPSITEMPQAQPGSIQVPSSGKMLYIDQSLQVMRVYEDGVEVRTIPVSTGLRMSYTPAFSGRVSYYVNKINSYGSFSEHAWYFTKATGNIYIHSSPYTVKDGQKHYIGLEWLGVKPSSHGCVRIHPLDANWLVEWDPRGVLLTVKQPDFVTFPD